MGHVGGYENLFVAAGHFRSGLQMSPGTARLMRQALLDQETDVPLYPFSCDRNCGDSGGDGGKNGDKTAWRTGELAGSWLTGKRKTRNRLILVV